jgi:hypothetical protein
MLRHLLPHARRVAEVPLTFRYDLRRRPSRFKAFQTCMSLARLRRSAWPETPSEAA